MPPFHSILFHLSEDFGAVTADSKNLKMAKCQAINLSRQIYNLSQISEYLIRSCL